MRVAAAAVVIAVVLTAAAAPAAPDDADEPGSDPSILILGDSLCVGARHHEDGLAERFEDAGWDPTFVCRSGEPVAWGIAEVDDMESVPSVVVVALGTNPRAREPGFVDLLDELRSALVDRGAERLVWVDYADLDGDYRGKTHRLHHFADRHGDEIVHWSATVSGHPDWFRSDGLHYRPPGVVAWSAAIAATVATPGLDPELRIAVERLSLVVADRMVAAAIEGDGTAGLRRSVR